MVNVEDGRFDPWDVAFGITCLAALASLVLLHRHHDRLQPGPHRNRVAWVLFAVSLLVSGPLYLVYRLLRPAWQGPASSWGAGDHSPTVMLTAHPAAQHSTAQHTPAQQAAAAASRMDARAAAAHATLASNKWVIGPSKLRMGGQIGSGAFGTVYRGSLGSTAVAVKCLPPLAELMVLPGGRAKDHNRLRALEREVELLTKIRSPHVVLFMGVCLDPLACVTEYCAQGSLFDVLRRARKQPEAAARLTWKRRLNMALEAALGMLYLHNMGVLHRDLKSPNLLVDASWKVKVGDFGLAVLVDNNSMTQSLAATNPRWMAAEVIGGGAFTMGADVFAFGVVLWELLTFQEPFTNMLHAQIVHAVMLQRKRLEVPPLDQLIGGTFAGIQDYISLMHWCWADDSRARPNFETVVAQLRHMLEGVMHT